MRKICRTILAAGLMACMMMPAVNVMAADNIVGNWQADEAGVGFAKISASLVGLDGLCININEDNTADIIFAVDGDETKAVKNVKIEEKEGEKYFDVKIPDADSPSLSEGQKKLAEFENFDADLYLSRIEEQPYLHCWDRLPSEFPEK